MNQITDAMDMVEHLRQPAFCVQDGIIVKVNPAALGRMIQPGTPVEQLLKTGTEEYREFSDGCLYLTLKVCDQELGFSVNRKHGFDLFQLEQDTQSPELQSLALAARELREPLAGIMISADHLFPETSEDPAVNTQIARINQGLYQMLRLISNMSDAGRYATTGSVSMEVKNVSALLDEIFTKAAALVEQAGIKLEYSGINDPVYSLVNAELLERAVLNVVSNALKFTSAGGAIQAKAYRRGSKLYLSIMDSGSGLPEHTRSNLFSRYTREPGLEDGRFGIGLGFVIIRSAAQQHGGTVLVDQPGGTRVTLTLSIRPGSTDQVRSPILRIDYAGERDHGLLELSDVLPSELYSNQ